jgi:hypothetical protein
MGKIGDGYGSEWQLQEYLRSDPDALSHEVARATGGAVIRWLGPPPAGYGSREWKGMDFLPENHPARQSWKTFWPQSGNVQNWDAVGEIARDGRREWLLVEAKAHLDEIKSSCKATSSRSRETIVAALDSTKRAMQVNPSRDWLRPYYQYANRLAALYFLTEDKIPARLVMVYFFGDTREKARCPQTEEEWRGELRTMHEHLGLTAGSLLESRVHELFLPARVATRA